MVEADIRGWSILGWQDKAKEIIRAAMLGLARRVASHTLRTLKTFTNRLGRPGTAMRAFQGATSVTDPIPQLSRGALQILGLFVYESSASMTLDVTRLYL